MPVGLDQEEPKPFGALALRIAGLSDTGRQRTVNQDAFDRFDDPERGEILLVVADGLGGHRCGEIASRMAVGILGKLCFEIDGDPEVRLRAALDRANHEIYSRARNDTVMRGMGTTLVALLLRREGPSWVAHVGDSRLYRIAAKEPSQGAIEAMTEDHSVVSLLLREGAITADEARTHPKRNQILRAVGVAPEVEGEFAPLEIQQGERYLLCSDGLHGPLPEADLDAIARGAPDPRTAVAWMIDAANQAGGPDNITAVLVEIGDEAGALGPTADAGARARAVLAGPDASARE